MNVNLLKRLSIRHRSIITMVFDPSTKAFVVVSTVFVSSTTVFVSLTLVFAVRTMVFVFSTIVFNVLTTVYVTLTIYFITSNTVFVVPTRVLVFSTLAFAVEKMVLSLDHPFSETDAILCVTGDGWELKIGSISKTAACTPKTAALLLSSLAGLDLFFDLSHGLPTDDFKVLVSLHSAIIRSIDSSHFQNI